MADIVLEWREERITVAKQARGSRTVKYKHYLDELAKKPQAVRQVAPELMAELGAPYEQLWRLLSDRYGELEAARVVAKLAGAIVEHGEQLVAQRSACCGAAGAARAEHAAGDGAGTGDAAALPSGIDARRCLQHAAVGERLMSDLTDAVIEQHLKTLKLPTMRRAYGQVARQAGADSWTYAEYLRELLDREIRAREASTTARRLREARFPDLKTLGQIDWDTMAGVSKQQIIELATCGFVLRLSILTRAPVQGRNDIVAAELQTISGVTTCQPNSGSWGYVGVDWATRQHQICVLDGDGKVVGERQVAHSGDRHRRPVQVVG